MMEQCPCHNFSNDIDSPRALVAENSRDGCENCGDWKRDILVGVAAASMVVAEVDGVLPCGGADDIRCSGYYLYDADEMVDGFESGCCGGCVENRKVYCRDDDCVAVSCWGYSRSDCCDDDLEHRILLCDDEKWWVCYPQNTDAIDTRGRPSCRS